MTGSPPPSEATTILLVDDELAVRSIIVKILRRSNYIVLEAESGREAVKVAESHPGKIDLVIADLHMPGQQGPEVVKALTALRPRLNVLFISGYAEHDVVSRTGVGEGANFLHKPFSGQELNAAVQAAIR